MKDNQVPSKLTIQSSNHKIDHPTVDTFQSKPFHAFTSDATTAAASAAAAPSGLSLPRGLGPIADRPG